jgi:ABC-type transport system involved in multi-copper enzyme maturation permease subunit
VTTAFETYRLLIRDTFRQANASGITWMMLAVTAICTIFCLSVSIAGDVRLHGSDDPPLFLPEKNPFDIGREAARRDGVDTVSGKMSIGFGAVSFPVARERGDAVRFIELLLSGLIAGALGLLLALVWTAGFAPTFLEAGAASVLLAKPVSRGQLLVGKWLGVLAFVGVQVALFVLLTWAALGLRTGVWDLTYWWCVPILLLQFASFYGFSLVLAVLTRSTVACVFGALLFWGLAWGINAGRILVLTSAEAQSLPPATVALADAAYCVMPKPVDAGLILFNTLDAQQHFEKPSLFQSLEASGRFSALLSLLSSFLIALALLGIAVYEFESLDY